MRSSVPFILLVLCLTQAAHSQPLREWTNYTDVNDVNDITSYGDTIWLATNGGLVRFLESDPTNGVRITNADGLGDNQVRFVTVDSSGVLWCGGENGRLSRRRHDKSWRVYPFNDETGLPIRLNAAAPGPDGFLWIASDKGVHKFDTQRNGGEIKESYTRIGTWPDESRVNDVVIMGSVIIWLVGDAGYAHAPIDDPFLLDRARWRATSTQREYTSIAESASNPWMGSFGVLLRDPFPFTPLPETIQITDPFQDVRDLATCEETTWIVSSNGYGWIDRLDAQMNFIPGAVPAGFTSVHCTGNAVYFGQTDGGVWRLQDGSWTHIELSGPLDNNLNDIAVDERGRVWAAHTNRGASFLDDDGWHTIPYIVAGPGGPMTSVDVAPNGDIWYGLFGGGVWHVDGNTPLNPASATNFKKPNSSLMWVQNAVNPNDFGYVVVQDVVVDRQGRVWAANALSDSGAVIAWNDNGCWGRFDANDGINSNTPIALYPLDSSVLVGFGNIGVMEINFNEPLCSGGQPVNQIPRLARRSTADGLPSDLVTSLLYDNSDSLWVGTSLGLARYARDRRRFFTVPMPAEAGLTVNALAVDANNGIWIGTSLGLVIREADGSMSFFNSRNSGLVGDFVAEIDIDPQTGDVWIATRSGISQTRGPLPAAADIENAVAYPNPFVIGEVERVRFNAPSGSRITITTVSGHQITVIDSDTGWNGRNSAGEEVATGVCLFAVRSPAGEYGRGKIAVIRR